MSNFRTSCCLLLFLGLALLVLSCKERPHPKYYNIEIEEFTNFPNEEKASSTIYLSTLRTPDRVFCEMIEGDSNLLNKEFHIVNDSILGDWSNMGNYIIRLLYPDLHIKDDNSQNRSVGNTLTPAINRTLVEEDQGNENWIVRYKFGEGVFFENGLMSSLKGKVTFLDHQIVLDVVSKSNTPARVFITKSVRTLSKLSMKERIAFESKKKFLSKEN